LTSSKILYFGIPKLFSKNLTLS